MSEIKYKGIDLKAIKEVQAGLKNCKAECFEFSEEKLLESLETDETVMGHILGVIKRIEMKQREATDMYIICEMARLWLEHCRDMQEIVEKLEEMKNDFENKKFDKKHCQKMIYLETCLGRNCFECVLNGAIEIVKGVINERD